MKHVKLAASAFILASLFTSVTYAKVSYKGEVAPMAPAFSWTGFYVGANVGGVGYSQYVTDIDESDFDSTLHLDPNGKWSGGAQIGWRYQVDCAMASGVFGIEGSVDWTDAKYSRTFGVTDYDIDTKLKSLWMVQAMGGIAVDRTLLFLGAGAGWADLDGSWTDLAGDTTRNFDTNKTVVGPVVSAGIEYAFTDMISVRAKVDELFASRYTRTDGRGNSFLINNNIVQGTIGLNVKFA
jgi:outer membrane immunogenic protein